MSFVMGSPISMPIVFYLSGTKHKVISIRRIALMACSSLSEVAVDEGGGGAATLNGGNLAADNI